ncbi:MAG: class I SAM-dependent methyltransferase, partial [Bacteroidota bacterium]|nr:class I SAM-dependent methyltransferase [Bacteroidota bacterium]
PFRDKELSGIVMIDVLHHIPTPANFFKEAVRTLKPGGKIVMTEPANTLWGRFIYQNFHHEPFRPEAGWEIPSTGPLSGANGALPWIIFNRDRAKFENEYPELEIKSITHHTPLRYLISGGVSMKALVPAWSFGVITFLEKLIWPAARYFSMFQTIEIIKR